NRIISDCNASVSLPITGDSTVSSFAGIKGLRIDSQRGQLNIHLNLSALKPAKHESRLHFAAGNQLCEMFK
ncbi:MAG: hypothetical protein PHY78_13085, partial [Desulfobacterales bacterium]|nr:hypothetical protein [Desulfobacterales bacterium]